jgi:hypothetical protein
MYSEVRDLPQKIISHTEPGCTVQRATKIETYQPLTTHSVQCRSGFYLVGHPMKSDGVIDRAIWGSFLRRALFLLYS